MAGIKELSNCFEKNVMKIGLAVLKFSHFDLVCN